MPFPPCSLRSFSAAVLLTIAFCTAQAQDDRHEPVSLNFVNADIQSVVTAVGRITGQNFLIDPRVGGTLNIVTNTPVPREMTYPILLSALRLQGFTAIEDEGIIKIVPEADAKLHGAPVASPESGNRGDTLVTRVFTLRHEPAAQMLAVVRPLVAPNNIVTAFPSNNSLIVTDYARNLERIAKVIESIDVPQGDVSVIPLEHAAAADVAVTVHRLFNESGAGTQVVSESYQRVQVVPEPRTNSLLVRTENPARLREIRHLVASLDRPGAGGNIHVVYLKNARAESVADTLNAALAGGEGIADLSAASFNPTEGASRHNVSLSAGAVVQADAVNNALIIVAPESVYRNLRHVVDKLDRRRAQVFIEALIAEISSDRAAEFGIQWQSTQLGDSGTSVLGGANFGGSGQNIIGAAANIASVGKGLNLMVGRGTVKVPINGEMVEVFNLALLARFLETDSRTNILSTPTIVTLDNEEAKIVVGRNLPFVTGQFTNTGGGTTPENPFQTIERRDVGLTLQVRPQISEGGTIKLEIFQEASSVLPTLDDSRGPVTNTRSIQSSVLIDDGAIIALGGLVEDSFSAGEEKVPVLGDIPIAGNLFRYRNRQRTKTNLVVFLRPVILRDESSYSEMTQSRYDYVIGQQRAVSEPVRLMRNEPTAPQLPALAASSTPEGADEHLIQLPAPVVDARIVPVAAATWR